MEQAALIFCQAYAAAPYNESWKLADASAYLRRFRDGPYAFYYSAINL